MTPQEVIELIEKEKEIIRENMEHNKKLFESGETDLDMYNIDLMHAIERTTPYIDDGLTITETIEMLSDFLEEIKVHENKPAFDAYMETDVDARAFGHAGWYEPFELSEEAIEAKAKQKVKEFVNVQLCPPATYRRYIDCKLLSLFMDGTIDWKALQKLVYSDCNI